MQQAATARISSEATHILDNTLTNTDDELILEGKKTEGAKTTELLPTTFSDEGLEDLRKEVNEANRSKAIPNRHREWQYKPRERRQPSSRLQHRRLHQPRIKVNILLPELLIYLIRGIDKPLNLKTKLNLKPKQKLPT